MAGGFSTVRCAGCGQLNRHASDIGRSGTFTCGKCGSTLLSVVSTNPTKAAGSGSKLGPVLAVIFIAGVAYASYDNWKRGQLAQPVSVAKQESAPPARPSLPDTVKVAAPKPLSQSQPSKPTIIATPPSPQPSQSLDISPTDLARNQAAKPSAPPVVPSVDLSARERLAALSQGNANPVATVPAKELKLLATPRTGVIQSGAGRGGSAPFKLITDNGGDYVVKLVNVARPRDQVVIFVRGGETFETKMPLGQYKFRAATGLSWYGREELFGPDTRFFELRDKGSRMSSDTLVLRFYKDGNRIHGRMIQLQAVLDGNLEHQSMSRSEFNSE